MTDLEAAVAAWTRARLRWLEFSMSEVGSDAFRRLLPERAARQQEMAKAETALLRLGMAILEG